MLRIGSKGVIVISFCFIVEECGLLMYDHPGGNAFFVWPATQLHSHESSRTAKSKQSYLSWPSVVQWQTASTAQTNSRKEPNTECKNQTKNTINLTPHTPPPGYEHPVDETPSNVVEKQMAGTK